MRWVTGASLKSVVGRMHNGRGTIRICKDRNILKEYLMHREVEVITIAHKKDRETAERLIKKGKMSLEDIADCVPGLSFHELKEIEMEIMQLV